MKEEKSEDGRSERKKKNNVKRKKERENERERKGKGTVVYTFISHFLLVASLRIVKREKEENKKEYSMCCEKKNSP